jgi:hypothetical protein
MARAVVRAKPSLLNVSRAAAMRAERVCSAVFVID